MSNDTLVEGLGDHEMSAAFGAFFRRSWTDSQNWQVLQDAGVVFFTRHRGDHGRHDAFFGAFGPLIQSRVAARDFVGAQRIWESALNISDRWERENSGSYIHKGTAYYYWAASALEAGDLETAYLVMHRALEEDVRKANGQWPGGAAAAFVTLDYQEENQALREEVSEQANFLEEFLRTYRNTRHSVLTLGDVKRRFLSNVQNRDAVFLFSLTLARLKSLVRLPAHVRDNPFAGQIGLNVLLDLVQVVESSIATWELATHGQTFPAKALALSARAGLALTQDDIGDLNQGQRGNFEATIASLVDSIFQNSRGRAFESTECDIGVAYVLRNRAAHHVGGSPVVRSRFVEVTQRVANALFLVIDRYFI